MCTMKIFAFVVVFLLAGALASERRQATSCSTTADCASDECCVNLNRPDGRRRQVHAFAECKKIGGDGDPCMVQITTVQDLQYDCPCASGLTCKGNGMFDIPLGEMGTCTA